MLVGKPPYKGLIRGQSVLYLKKINKKNKNKIKINKKNKK
jgi:hypothetical protein